MKNPNDSSSEEEDSDEDSSSDEEEADKPVLTREQRRAAAKAKKEAAIAKKQGKVPQAGDMPSSSEEDSEEDDMPANPNHSKAARNQATLAPEPLDDVTEGVKELGIGGKAKAKPIEQLSRREREAVQAQQAKERYQKLHEAGKTDEAKADLARLKLIREKREAEAARKLVSTSILLYLCLANLEFCRLRRKSKTKLRRRRRHKSTLVRLSSERQLWVLRKVVAKVRVRSKLGPSQRVSNFHDFSFGDVLVGITASNDDLFQRMHTLSFSQRPLFAHRISCRQRSVDMVTLRVIELHTIRDPRYTPHHTPYIGVNVTTQARPELNSDP